MRVKTTPAGALSGCRPQELHLASCSKFFEPVFVVESAENVLYSDPASGWQLMPTGCGWEMMVYASGVRGSCTFPGAYGLFAKHRIPGAILSMLQMSKDPKYRSQDRARITPLYLDYKLNGGPTVQPTKS
jgi:hypothetical protein